MAAWSGIGRRGVWPVFGVLLCLSCGTEVLIRIESTVLPGGLVSRRVEAEGPERLDEKNHPKEGRLLEVARPRAWSRIEEGKNRVVLSGTFAGAAEIPPAFTLLVPSGEGEPRWLEEQDHPALETRDFAVLTRWRWSEVYGDPAQPADPGPVLDKLALRFASLLRDEVRREMGERIDTTPAELLIRGEGRSIAGKLALALRSGPGLGDETDLNTAVAQAVRRLGLPVAETREAKDYLEAQAWLLSARAREKVAQALSSEENPVEAEDLAFWPVSAEEFAGRPGFLTALISGAEEPGLGDQLEQSLFGGFFRGTTLDHFRFLVKVSLPGQLLCTNGTPEGNQALWFFRNTDVLAKGLAMQAESFVLHEEALRRLGARTDLGAAEVLEIVDILERGDRQGLIRALLDEALERRRLGLLRDRPENWPGEGRLADNLAALLEPRPPR